MINQSKNKIEELGENNNFNNKETNVINSSEEKENIETHSPGLFSDEEIIISEILSVDLNNITPMNALQTISRWKKTLLGQ